MLKAYRAFSLKNKVVIFIILMATIAAYCVNFAQSSFVPAVGGTALVILALHFMITFPRFFVIILVSAIQLVLLGYASLLYASIFNALFGTDALLAIVSSLIVLAVASCIILYIAINYGRGKLLLTLILSFVLLDFGGLVFAAFLGVPYAVTLFIAAILGVGFTILRSVRIFNRKVSEDSSLVRNQIFNLRTNKKITTILDRNKWEAFKVDTKENFWVVNTKKKILILVGIELQEKLRKSKNGYMYRTVPIENIFSEIIDEANKLSVQYKIPKGKVHLVIFDASSNYPLPAKGYQEYELAPKFDKTNTKSKFVVASSSGLNSFVSTIKDSLPESLWSKLVKN